MKTIDHSPLLSTPVTTAQRVLPESLLNLDDAVLLLDRHNHLVVDTNAAARQIFGTDIRGLASTELASYLSNCRFDVSGIISSTLTADNRSREVELHIGRPDSDGITAIIIIDKQTDMFRSTDDENALRVRLIMEERERFARDLHDGVTQEVIAAAMSLAAVIPIAPVEIRDRLEDVVDRQEVILHNLRETVFGLKENSRRRVDPVKALTQSVFESSRALPHSPTVHIDGHVSEIADPAFLGSVNFALREMISNVCRHAHATNVEVRIGIRNRNFYLLVRDDGVGIGSDVRRGNGLSNLEARAAGAGGRFTIARNRSGFTEAHFVVPCPEVRS